MEIPVIQKQERMSPLSRGSSHFFFCSSLPNMWSTSIFPVSVEKQHITHHLPEYHELNMEYNMLSRILIVLFYLVRQTNTLQGQ